MVAAGGRSRGRFLIEMLTRAQLDAAPRELLSRGSRVKPAVYRVTAEGAEALIVKDVHALPALTRPLARLLMRREQRILQRLAGVGGVPQLRAQPDRDCFAVGVLPGVPLTGEAFEAQPQALATGLRQIIAAMHEHGVFHLDLRQRQNILVEGKTVSIVDFGAAWMPNRLLRPLLGPVFRWVDRQAVLKYVARHAPTQLTPAEGRAVLRFLRLRRLWFVSPHNDSGEWEAAKRAAQREKDGA